jgi:hypothetical protein
MSEGASLITINPATLDDTNLWSYQDLRALCKRVKLKGNGKRDDLVERLQAWNRLRVNEGVAGLSELVGSPNDKKNWLSMNVEGANFALLGQNVVPRAISPVEQGLENKAPTVMMHSPNQGKGVRRRSSTSTSPRPARASSKNHAPSAPSSTQKKKSFNFDVDGHTMAVSPTLLKPLNMLPGEQDNHEVTPGKSILKQHIGRRDTASEPGSATKISFSPFNGTKVIPHRRAPNTTGKQFWQDEDEDDAIMEDSREEEEEDDDDNNPDMIDLDNNYVNAEAARNAEQNASIGAGRDEETEEGSSDESAQELWERAF